MVIFTNILLLIIMTITIIIVSNITNSNSVISWCWLYNWEQLGKTLGEHLYLNCTIARQQLRSRLIVDWIVTHSLLSFLFNISLFFQAIFTIIVIEWRQHNANHFFLRSEDLMSIWFVVGLLKLVGEAIIRIPRWFDAIRTVGKWQMTFNLNLVVSKNLHCCMQWTKEDGVIGWLFVELLCTNFGFWTNHILLVSRFVDWELS